MSAMTISPMGAIGTGRARPVGRLTPRGRLVAAGLVFAVLGGGFGLGRAAADGPPAAIEVSTYTVAPGDTLWAIAAGVAGEGQDVRDVIATIQDLNNLTDSAIVAGARLLLPAS